MQGHSHLKLLFILAFSYRFPIINGSWMYCNGGTQFWLQYRHRGTFYFTKRYYSPFPVKLVSDHGANLSLISYMSRHVRQIMTGRSSPLFTITGYEAYENQWLMLHKARATQSSFSTVRRR